MWPRNAPRTPLVAARSAGLAAPFAPSLPVLGLACLIAAGSGTTSNAQCVSYEAASGELPTAQGWTAAGTGMASLQDGLLEMSSGVQSLGYFAIPTTTVPFSWAAGATMELSARVHHSDYYNFNNVGATVEAGFAFGGADSSGNYFGVRVASDRVFITNRVSGQHNFFQFNPADRMHAYRLSVLSGRAALYIDDVRIMSAPTGTPNGPMEIHFGDISGNAAGIASVEVVRFAPVAADISHLEGLTCPTGTLAFNGEAAGTGPITYHWQIHTSPGGWTDLETDAILLPCGGTAVASAPQALATSITIRPCPGLYAYLIRLLVESSCGATAPSRIMKYRACPADFNCSDTMTVQDVFEFLAAFFAGDTRADINQENGISVQDIFDFLKLYFEGCQYDLD